VASTGTTLMDVYGIGTRDLNPTVRTDAQLSAHALILLPVRQPEHFLEVPARAMPVSADSQPEECPRTRVW
jgi:hypothetical protein